MSAEDEGDRHLNKSPEDGESEEEAREGPPRRVIRQMMSMIASVGNPLMEKIESRHIDRALDLSDRQSERNRTSEKEGRIFLLVAGLLLLAF